MVYDDFIPLTPTEWKQCGIVELQEHYKMYKNMVEKREKSIKK